MKLFIFLFLSILITGCTSTPKNTVDDNFIHYSKGGENIDAHSKNPLLKCLSSPKIARLDKSYDDRVFIDEHGRLCK